MSGYVIGSGNVGWEREDFILSVWAVESVASDFLLLGLKLNCIFRFILLLNFD